MTLGINLGFCVKRWVTPDLWAPLVRDDLGLDTVQFTFFEPVYGKYRARPEPWFERLAKDVALIHLQQTDGQLDRHWDFTQRGDVDPASAAAALSRAGLSDAPVFLEVFYPFERDDASVLAAVRETAALLRPHFTERGPARPSGPPAPRSAAR